MTNRSFVARYLPFAILFFFASAALAQSKPPLPRFTTGPVVDETGSLNDRQIAALDQKLNTYHDSTGTWIAIALINSANGYPLEDLAIEIADSNGLKAKNNNVAIILLSMSEHKGFIATGYGLEPTLTDAATGMIYREILVPALRRGDVYSGLDSATTAMIQIVDGEFHTERSPLHRQPNAPSVTGVFLIVAGFFILMFLLRALAGTGARRTVVGAGGGGSGCMGGILQGLFWSSIFNTGRRGWGGGGGFGGGGFGGGSGGWGGFGGGGGGSSFGGGGAGGGW